MDANLPAWHIVTWPAVNISLERWEKLSRFELKGWSSRQDSDGRLIGNTLWASDEVNGAIGLAWEWCELNPNVFVMTDPMSVLSNATLDGDDDGQAANEFKRVLHLNNTVYQLPWQQSLRSLVRSRKAMNDVSALAVG